MLLAEFYAAASGNSSWSSALSGIERVAGATGCHLIGWSPASNKGLLSVVTGVDPSSADDYAGHYGAINPRRLHAERLPVGSIFRCHSVFDDAYARNSEFYRDYLAKYDVRYLSAANFLREDGNMAHIAALRSERAGPFGDDEAEMLELLLPHLQQAFRMQNMLEAADEQRKSARALLDRFPGPAAIVNRDGFVQEMNADMDCLVRHDGPVVLHGGRLIAHSQGVAKQLALAVRRASAGMSEAPNIECRIRITDTSANTFWIATVWPLTTASASGLHLGRCGALVALTDLMRERRIDPRTIQDLLRLSPAEARLAAALAVGETLNEVAGRTGVSQNTVRSQLKSVFTKLDISTQADLVRMMGDLADQPPQRT